MVELNEKRFTEIISVEKVIDTETGKEYKCIIDNELLELLNHLHKENEELREENEKLRKCINEIYTIARLEEV